MDLYNPLPYKDFTLKAKLPRPREVENALIEMNAEFIGADFQTDRYFETSKGKLKWREGTIENLITHYERFKDSTTEKTIVYRYDLSPDRADINELLQKHKLIGVIRKQRKIFQIKNIKIHLDKLPNNEEFIEIEAIDRRNELTIEELRNQCMEIKSKLNISDQDLIPTGYFK